MLLIWDGSCRNYHSWRSGKEPWHCGHKLMLDFGHKKNKKSAVYAWLNMPYCAPQMRIRLPIYCKSVEIEYNMCNCRKVNNSQVCKQKSDQWNVKLASIAKPHKPYAFQHWLLHFIKDQHIISVWSAIAKCILMLQFLLFHLFFGLCRLLYKIPYFIYIWLNTSFEHQTTMGTSTGFIFIMHTTAHDHRSNVEFS